MVMTRDEQIQFGLLGVRSSKYQGVKPDTQRKHEEADLHLSFCKWVKKEYPQLQFVRHEREKARSKFMGNLMQVYNTDWDKLPDFELLAWSGLMQGRDDFMCGLYIEFKKPGRQWQSNGKIKADCAGQYECHRHLWSIGRCAYFCNDLEFAKQLLIAYLSGNPKPMQVYECTNGQF